VLSVKEHSIGVERDPLMSTPPVSVKDLTHVILDQSWFERAIEIVIDEPLLRHFRRNVDDEAIRVRLGV